MTGKEALDAIIAGLDGVTPGRWFDWESMEWLVEPQKLLSSEAATLIARCDPDAMRAIAAYVAEVEDKLEVAEDKLEHFGGLHEKEYRTAMGRADLAEARLKQAVEVMGEIARQAEGHKRSTAYNDGVNIALENIESIAVAFIKEQTDAE
jgi:hypothetical protein